MDDERKWTKREVAKESLRLVRDLAFLGGFWLCIGPPLALPWIRYTKNEKSREKRRYM